MRTLGRVSLAVCLVLFCRGGALAQDQNLRFELQDNLIRVPVTISGNAGQAVLDSGTGALALDLGFARTLGMQANQSAGMAPGGGAPVQMFSIVANELIFGPERLTNVPGVAIDLGHLTSSAGFPVEVLLGKPVFEKRALRIDYPRRLIEFLPEGKTPTCADRIPFTFIGGSPAIAVTVRATAASPATTLHLIVDLGTRHYAAMLGGPFLETADGKALLQQGKPMQVGTGTGGAVMGSTAQVSSLTIGKHQFQGPTPCADQPCRNFCRRCCRRIAGSAAVERRRGDVRLSAPDDVL